MTTLGGKQFRPLLAATIESDEDLEKLDYPLIASPKVDGIRVLCHFTLGPVTRSLKPVPNAHIRKSLLDIVHTCGMDGEIVSGDITAKDVFNRTTSAVMTYHGTPEFTYWVFDYFYHNDHAYSGRLNMMHDYIRQANHPQIRALELEQLDTPEGVRHYEQWCLSLGFEGIMLRHRSGPYKWGRSTLKQQTLMKLKRFKDAEATVIGFEPLYHNTNPQERNILGLAERRDSKAGKVEADTLGNLLVNHDGGFGKFSIGSGFGQALRDEIWQNKDKYFGKTVTFKYQECGVVDKPRFPIFKGFRPQE